MAYMLKNLIQLLAPLIPFTSEEAWLALPECLRGDDSSVHLSLYPDSEALLDTEEDGVILEGWEPYLEVRKTVLKELEEKRAAGDIGGGLDAMVSLTVPQDMVASANGEDWSDFLIVSYADVRVGDEFTVSVEKATGSKCNRCWKILPEVGSCIPDDVCARCAEVLKRFGS